MSSFVRWTVLGFCLVLIAAGLPPLLAPGSSGLLSAAPAYAWFHLVSAAVGIVLVLATGGRGAPAFALAFGLADLYQAVASAQGWFPRDLFLWTPTDDRLHWTLGAALVLLGGLGVRFRRAR